MGSSRGDLLDLGSRAGLASSVLLGSSVGSRMIVVALALVVVIGVVALAVQE